MLTPRHHPVPDEKRLWIVALAPPVLWATQFLLGYAISEIGCQNDLGGITFFGWSVTTSAILGLTLAALVVLVWSGGSAYRIWRASRDAQAQNISAQENDAPNYRGFMAQLGVWHSVIFGITILATGLASLAINRCA